MRARSSTYNGASERQSGINGNGAPEEAPHKTRREAAAPHDTTPTSPQHGATALMAGRRERGGEPHDGTRHRPRALRSGDAARRPPAPDTPSRPTRVAQTTRPPTRPDPQTHAHTRR